MGSRRTYGCLLCLGLLAWGAPARSEEHWTLVKEKDGVRYERQALAGSKFQLYRATMFVPVPTSDALEAIWLGVTTKLSPTVVKRTVLSRSETEVLVHDHLHAPVVSDREVTLKLERIAVPPSVRFTSRNDLGPPPEGSHVVLPVVRGAWSLTPSGTGTILEFTCYSEPGGSLPAFMVRGAQQTQIMRDVERILGMVMERRSQLVVRAPARTRACASPPV